MSLDTIKYVHLCDELNKVSKALGRKHFYRYNAGWIREDVGASVFSYRFASAEGILRVLRTKLANERAAPLCLNSQDRNTILAALRYYQSRGMGEPGNRSDEIHDIATNGDTDISMDSDGIDELCQRINA